MTRSSILVFSFFLSSLVTAGAQEELGKPAYDKSRHPWLKWAVGSSVTFQLNFMFGDKTYKGKQTLSLEIATAESFTVKSDRVFGGKETDRSEETFPEFLRKEIVDVQGGKVECGVWKIRTKKTSGESSGLTIWIEPSGGRLLKYIKVLPDGSGREEVRAVKLEEEVTVGGRKVSCVKLEGSDDRKGEILAVTYWWSLEIPGGMVKAVKKGTAQGQALVATMETVSFRDPSQKPILKLPRTTTDKELEENLAGRENLKELDLGGCSKITSEGFALLGNLRNLEVLNLRQTGVTDAGMEHLRGLVHLRKLYLDGTKISGKALVPVGTLENLDYLSLINTRIPDEGLEHLKGLVRLRFLVMARLAFAPRGSGDISDAGLAHLAGLKNLIVLLLQGNKWVSDAGLVHLSGLKKLRKLSLEKTSVTDSGVSRFRESVPGCQVTRLPDEPEWTDMKLTPLDLVVRVPDGSKMEYDPYHGYVRVFLTKRYFEFYHRKDESDFVAGKAEFRKKRLKSKDPVKVLEDTEEFWLCNTGTEGKPRLDFLFRMKVGDRYYIFESSGRGSLPSRSRLDLVLKSIKSLSVGEK